MTRHISRRASIQGLAALAGSFGLYCVPLKVYSQRSTSLPRIGVILVVSSPESKEARAFQQGLRDAGYEPGRDVFIDWRYANGDYDQIPGAVDDLIRSKADVILVETTRAALAAKRATSTVPIVMALVADPVTSGLVPNFAHPGGNVTGLSLMLAQLSTKRLQLLREALPHASRVAVFWDPATPWHPNAIEELKLVSAALSSKLSFVAIGDAEEIDQALPVVSKTGGQALYALESPLFYTHRMTLAKLALQARLPTMFGDRQFVDAGGLMSYGANFADLFRRAAGYVDRILKGAKAGDLPIEQPTSFELVVNLRTAAALGLTIPKAILVRADDVIR